MIALTIHSKGNIKIMTKTITSKNKNTEYVYHFDFSKKTLNVYINGMYSGSAKVYTKAGYVFKCMNSNIYADGGIQGLYKFFEKISIENFGIAWIYTITNYICK